jgi:lysyl-tRNA synthetase, class II
MDQINERKDRIRKLENLKNLGINPYPSKSKRTHTIKEVFDNFKELEKETKNIYITGRLKSMRGHGNLTFANLEDESGKIQLAISKKEVGADQYKLFVKNLDMGDFIEANGITFLTHKGEQSINVKGFKILAKAIRPLPEKWHGLSDSDKKQRFRELEMISNKETTEKFKRRFKATKAIRDFMWGNDFTEVETPILQNVYGGTYAKPFTTHYNALDFNLYLRIAPEIFLKRSVVGGFEKIFEIGKCFRNEGMGPAHLQEFTMFEFYWPYTDYEKLMTFTEKLIKEVVEKVYKNYKVKYGEHEINLKPPYPRKTFRELVKEYLKVELEEIDTVEKLEKFVKKNKLEKQANIDDKIGWSAKMDELYKKTIRNKIINPIFVTDYPKEFMALAKTKDDDPNTVATFQLVVNTWELIKAYNELNDPIDQKERFEAQERLIMEGDEEAMPYDYDFVESMEYGMPPMAGWGMGLDRFFSLLEGEDNLRDLNIFPTMKPKN